MSRYGDQVRDEYGRPVPGVSIYVYVWDADAQTAGDLAVLTDDLSAPLSNPLTSDADGLYYFNATDGQKLIEYHYGGKVQFRDLILVGAFPVPQAVFGGLLANAGALSIPVGMDLISTIGADALDHGGANYVAGSRPTPRSGFVSSNSRAFVLSKEQVITPQMFYQATDADFQNAMQGAADYLSTFTYGAGGPGLYNAAPTLMCPAASTYLMHARVDFLHTGKVVGEGSGQFGPGAFGATHFKWIGATSGFGVQSATTSGLTTVDGPHNGSGGLVLEDMCLEGDGGAEGEYHLLVLRQAVKAHRLYLLNARGEAVKALAGTVIGTGNIGGNVSTAYFESVKAESCRGAFHAGGSDGSLMTFVNCESYQCKWFGFLGDNGAGSTTVMGHHAASNGMISNIGIYTQCSSGGNRYAARWGGDFTVAPSGTTAHTANWYYIEAGGVIANLIPAHTATPNTFRAGGDYVTINSDSTVFSNDYSEGGTFSQFNAGAVIDEGTIGDQYSYGGIRKNTRSDGYRIRQAPNMALLLQHGSTSATIWAEDELGVQHSGITMSKTAGNDYYARDITGHRWYTSPYNGSLTLRGQLDNTGLFSGSGFLASSPSIGVGYSTGAGAAVTQLTSKSTATPAINKVCGQVTMNNAALAGGAKVSFVVTNSTVAATDTISVSITSGGTANAYRAAVTAISAGASFTVTVENITGGSLSEAPVVNFAIIRAVAA